MRKGATIEVRVLDLGLPYGNPALTHLHKDVCYGIHRSLVPNFNYALVW
jgi:hypothetical protein